MDRGFYRGFLGLPSAIPFAPILDMTGETDSGILPRGLYLGKADPGTIGHPSGPPSRGPVPAKEEPLAGWAGGGS